MLVERLFVIKKVATSLLIALIIGSSLANAESDDQNTHIRKLCLIQSYRKSRTSLCDPDGDGLTNRRETKLRTNRFRKDTDHDGLSDGKEVKKYHTNPRKSDTDGDGYKDGDEILAGTNPRDPKDHPTGSNACTSLPNPFDVNGNTTSFGIPSGLIGKISIGKTFFANTCFGCHGGDKGTNYTFPQIVAAVTGPKMGFSFPQQNFADLTAYLNRANIPPTPVPNCVLTPTPTGGGTAQATPTPTHIPGASCTPQPNPFDSSGNTTSFNIPAGIVGNITSGQTQFGQTCFGCHGADRGTNYDFPTLFAAVNGPPMFLSSLTQQQVANLVAYLNRTNIPPTPAPNCNASSTPTPTATPLSDIDRGALVYRGACSSCHTSARSMRGVSAHEINEAIGEVRQMQSIQLSSEQLRVLVIYFRSL